MEDFLMRLFGLMNEPGMEYLQILFYITTIAIGLLVTLIIKRVFKKTEKRITDWFFGGDDNILNRY